MAMSNLRLPTHFSDARLSDVVQFLYNLTTPNSKPIRLAGHNVKSLSPAAKAILSLVVDRVRMQDKPVICDHFSKTLATYPPMKHLQGTPRGKLCTTEEVSYSDSQTLVIARDATVHPLMNSVLEDHFSKDLSNEQLFHLQLLSNELIQNAADHSGAERTYYFAGPWKDHFQFGILDMGISIPARMERKYPEHSNVELLELALKKGFGTRQTREGGLGLHYLWEIMKQHGQRFVLMSRDAQVRKYFSTRRSQKGSLKKPLLGTWVLARLPKKGTR